MAKRAEAESDRVVPLIRRRSDEAVPDVAFGAQPVARRAEEAPGIAGVDLTGKPKVWLLVGTGKSGKTVEARWMVERMVREGRSAALMALDPSRNTRSLAAWFDGVDSPDGHPGRWLADTLEQLMTERVSAVLDFGGGGEPALAHCVERIDALHEQLEGAGLGLVLCYCVTRRIDDLAVVEQFESAGFRPQATAILLSPGQTSDSYEADREGFAPVLRHGVCKRVLDRGAVPVWVPPLESDVMDEIERKRLPFGAASEGRTEGGLTRPLSPFRAFMVRRWLDRMEKAHAPITTWLP